MAKEGLAVGMPIDLSNLPPVCQYCILGKQTKKAIPKARQGGGVMKLLEVIYADLTGPEDIASAGGVRYILNLVDDLSGMTWTYLIKKKSQAEKCFIEWHTLVENKT